MLLETRPPRQNRLLSKLSPSESRRFLGFCDEVELTFGKVLVEPGQVLPGVHFPLKGFISQIVVSGDEQIEVGLVGDEGMFGIPLSLGTDVSNVRALVQGGGTALRIGAKHFSRELERNAGLRHRIGLYTYLTINQLAQNVACNRFHVIEARLARWLLMTGDRAHSPSFAITQAFLAYMLGVRRVGVTKAARELQTRGLISYKRGAITIVNRKALEATSCRCYAADVASYKKVLA